MAAWMAQERQEPPEPAGARKDPPRALLPEAPTETGAPRGRWDSGRWQSGRSGAAAAISPSGPPATPTVTPGQATPGPGGRHRRPQGPPQLQKTTFPLWPPPAPPHRKGGTGTGMGTRHADTSHCFLTRKGALSAGHFPHLILPPVPGLWLAPNLEVTWARVSEPPSCCSRVVSVYSREGHTPPC